MDRGNMFLDADINVGRSSLVTIFPWWSSLENFRLEAMIYMIALIY